MGENGKVRFVRCPKCENLLPEFPDYSVYQCGGCGAVLTAKKKNLDDSNASERSDEEKAGMVSEKSETSEKPEKLPGPLVESKVDKVSHSEGSGETVVERLESDSKGEDSKWGIETRNESSSKTELGNGSLESKVNKLETIIENASGLRKSGRVFERKLSGIGEDDQFGRTRRGYFEGIRSSSSNYLSEGPSKYHLDNNYKYEASRGARADFVEPEREELLRKLDELRDQLSRVQNGNGRLSENVPVGRRPAPIEPYVESEDYFHDHLSGFHRVSRQFTAPNKHVAEAPYFDPYHKSFAVPDRADIAAHGYNTIRSSNYVPIHEDPFEPQMFRRPPPRIPSHHQYMSPELEPFEPHPCNTTLNHLSSSCYRCYDRQRQVPPQVPPSAFGNRRFPCVANNSLPRHHETHGAFGSHEYNSRMVNPPLGPCNPQPPARWPSDVKLENASASAPARPQRVVIANGRRCHPVAGGAPFVTCQNCFELLTLPKKVFTKKGEWEMSCGACSSVNSFAIVDEKLVSVNTSLMQSNCEVLDNSNVVVHGPMKRDNGSYCSEDYANSVYDFQAMDRDPVSSSTCQGVSSSKSEEMHNLHSVSATTSEDERFSDDSATRQAVTFVAEPPAKVATILPPMGSPPQDPFDYASKYRAVNRCGKGNLSSRSDQERVVTNKGTLRQNSLKESLATEMDISPNEYGNTGASKDSADKCREDDNSKGKKGDSFFAGIIKKSFRDLSRSNSTDSVKRNVSVNGHLIPDRLVKKAEKLAGPVYPGQYWYDYRAGFWGVMGGPCLGIIPPFIEEFNYPIPENCAAGNTGVFVNGRELHQKDLDLLSSRGLPATKDRSYIIEISGKVVDEDTGEELDNLGKLAPTIEKVKHGFGMRAPKAAA